jgi:PII-like signaling protein/Mg2+/Co2+ transporter CorC
MEYSSAQHKAKRLRIYIGESDQWHGRPLYAALLEQLKSAGLAGATVIRGMAGFGAHSRIHTASIMDLSENLPLIIDVVDTAENIERALETVQVLIHEGLVTLEEVDVIVYAQNEPHPLPANKRVREIMTAEPFTARVDQPLSEVWEIMLKQGIKALPVLNAQGRVAGILTHEDLLERAGLNARLAVAQRLDEDTLAGEIEILRASTRTAGDVMSQPAQTVFPDDTIRSAAEIMVRHSITRLPVIDAWGRLLGVVSRLDLLRQVLDAPGIPRQTLRAPASGRYAGEILPRKAPIVSEAAGLAEVIAAFLASGEHRVIVVNPAGQPSGMISDSDVVSRIQPTHRRSVLSALRGQSATPDLKVTAAGLISPGVETIDPQTSVVEAVQLMLRIGRKWLVVVDEVGMILGVIDREMALQALVR